MFTPRNGKPKFGLILDEDHDILVMLRRMFIGGSAPYSIDDLADEIGLSSHSLYKMFGADRPLRADVLLAAMCYAHRKNRDDRRIADYINNLLGLESRSTRMKAEAKKFMRHMESHLLDLFPEEAAGGEGSRFNLPKNGVKGG